MFFLLVRKELLEHLLSLRFALACIICLVIVASSTFVLSKDYKEALSDYHTNVIMHKNEVEESQDLVWDGIKVDKPLNPMQIFFKGVDRELSATAKIKSLGDPQFEASYEGNPVVFLFPSIDLIFFIGVVMSLLAIAFSYDAVAGEKELGTLKLLMSYSVPRDLVLLAKWTGGYLALIAPLLLSLLCGLVVVVLFPTVELQADHWTELGLILLLALFYLGAVYSLGLFVSARTPLASTAITVLLVIWVLIVLVVPNIAPYLAAQIEPLRSATAVDREKFQIERDENRKFEELMRRWEEEHPDYQNNRGAWWVYWDVEKRDQILRLVDLQQAVDDEFQKRMDAQIRLAKRPPIWPAPASGTATALWKCCPTIANKSQYSAWTAGFCTTAAKWRAITTSRGTRSSYTKRADFRTGSAASSSTSWCWESGTSSFSWGHTSPS